MQVFPSFWLVIWEGGLNLQRHSEGRWLQRPPGRNAPGNEAMDAGHYTSWQVPSVQVTSVSSGGVGTWVGAILGRDQLNPGPRAIGNWLHLRATSVEISLRQQRGINMEDVQGQAVSGQVSKRHPKYCRVNDSGSNPMTRGRAQPELLWIWILLQACWDYLAHIWILTVSFLYHQCSHSLNWTLSQNCRSHSYPHQLKITRGMKSQRYFSFFPFAFRCCLLVFLNCWFFSWVWTLFSVLFVLIFVFLSFSPLLSFSLASWGLYELAFSFRFASNPFIFFVYLVFTLIH